MNEPARVKPLFVVKPKTMSARDIRRAEKLANICIVECDDPDAARFLQPPPDAGLDQQALAALDLMRMILNSNEVQLNRGTITKWFVDLLLNSPKAKAVLSVKAK